MVTKIWIDFQLEDNDDSDISSEKKPGDNVNETKQNKKTFNDNHDYEKSKNSKKMMITVMRHILQRLSIMKKMTRIFLIKL